jgi:cbb3-type cytochrome oxidase subunit 3
MDINDIRSAVTLLGLIAFLALVRWAWTGARRHSFDAAARLPLAGDREVREDGASAARPPEGAHSPSGGPAAGRRGRHE